MCFRREEENLEFFYCITHPSDCNTNTHVFDNRKIKNKMSKLQKKNPRKKPTNQVTDGVDVKHFTFFLMRCFCNNFVLIFWVTNL